MLRHRNAEDALRVRTPSLARGAMFIAAAVSFAAADAASAVSLVTGDLLVVDLTGNTGETNDGLLRLARPLPDGQALWAGENFVEPSDLVLDAESGRLFFYGNGQGGKLWELDPTTGLATEIVGRGCNNQNTRHYWRVKADS